MYKNLIYILIFLVGYQYASGSNYASMYMQNENTDLISSTLSAGTELQITGYTELNSSGWLYASNQLTAGSGAAGNYQLRFSLSFSASSALWSIKIYKNSTELNELVSKRKIGSSDIGNVAVTGFVSISANDVIKVVVSADDNTSDFTPKHSQLTLIPIASATDPYVGEMYIYNNSSSQSLTTSWSTLNNFSAGCLNGFTYASNELTTPSDGGGYYAVAFSLSFRGDGPKDYDLGLSINGGSPDTLLLSRYLSGNADRGNALFSGIIYLNDNDVVSIKAKASTSASFIPVYANLSINSLNVSSSAYYGNNYINGNSNSLALSSSNAWYTEPDFSTGSINSGWSSTDSTLTASSSAEGFYLLNFNCAITYADAEAIGTYIYPLLAVFVNDVQLQNATFERKLQKKDHYDYGSIAGVALVRISASDVVKFKVSEVSGKDVNILDANINLVQLSTVKNLPVELVDLNAKESDAGIKINWTTLSETNNNYFDVEKSFDAHNFVRLSEVLGAGNSNIPMHYSFTDKEKNNDIVYYRLKQVDYDGKFKYSKIITIKVNNKTDINSFYSNGCLYLTASKRVNLTGPITIINSLGKTVYTGLPILNNNNGFTINLPYLSKGIYFVILKPSSNQAQTQTVKFIVY